MRIHLTILRLAARLTPREQREEWFAEWRSELWYVCQAGKPATAFCLGSFKDALWLRRNSPPSQERVRLESPALCLLMLAALAGISLMASAHFTRNRPEVRSSYPESQNLMIISRYRRPVTISPSVRIAEYQSWNRGDRRLFSGLAFYQPLWGRIQVAGERTANVTIARASNNLFDLLHVPLPGPETGVRLILSQAAWQEHFARDAHVIGRVVQVEGQQAVIAGVIPEHAWSLPGNVDAWLLEDSERLAALAPESPGFVLARANRTSFRIMSVPNASGDRDYYDCVPLPDGGKGTAGGFLLIVMIAGLLLPTITPLSLGEYPTNRDLRRWVFLVTKSGLVLLMVYCGAHYVTYHGGPVHGVIAGCILAFRWILVDQRRRCPVCLRLLANPVRIGRPSQTFLEWYGTELLCTRGHGLLHVTELPSSCYGLQRWMGLDRSWSSLFSGGR